MGSCFSAEEEQDPLVDKFFGPAHSLLDTPRKEQSKQPPENQEQALSQPSKSQDSAPTVPQTRNSSGQGNGAVNRGGTASTVLSSSVLPPATPRRTLPQPPQDDDDGPNTRPTLPPRIEPPLEMQTVEETAQQPLDQQNRNIEDTTTPDFESVYQLDKKLGYGAFGEVFVGKHKHTGATYAIKKIDRSKMIVYEKNLLRDEIDNLFALREGPNILTLYEVYDDDVYAYLVTELMGGGELFDRIVQKSTFSENEARHCFRCVLSGLKYMHERKIAHRDLKPDNLLLADRDDFTSVKLADFGFSKSLKNVGVFRTLCGTPGYIAPEILQRFPLYGIECDMFSAGVILYILVSGTMPFQAKDMDKIFEQTRKGEYDFPPKYWNGVSSSVKQLITRCLVVNPTKRVTAADALAFKWMVAGEAELTKNKLNVSIMLGTQVLGLKTKFKAAVKTLLAANRLNQLTQDVNKYLDEKKEDSTLSHFTLMAGAAKPALPAFIEDSLTGRPFYDFYDVGDQLGEGGFANVFRCTRKKTGQTYAVKHVMVNKMEEQGLITLQDEIEALTFLRGGPHIVRLYDVFNDDPDNCFLILEECKGGNLLTRIAAKEVYTEREARRVCQMLFEAINYCHQKQIAHRDIKPENMLLVDAGNDTTIKLADFGFAKKVRGEKSLRTYCGTPFYVAPEIVDPMVDRYDHRCDLWSAGIVVFLLLGGYVPFEGPLENIVSLIIKGEYEFHEIYWKDISASAKEMIRSLLQVQPNDRASAQLALSSTWMSIQDESLILKDLSKAQAHIRKSVLASNLSKKASAKISQVVLINNKWTSLMGVTKKSKTVHSRNAYEQELRFEDVYELGTQIGTGAFAVTYDAVHRQSKKAFDVQCVARKNIHSSDAVALHDEIAVLKLLTNCHQIIKLEEVYDEPDYTFLVLESLRGGDLIDQLAKRINYSGADAIAVCQKLMMGVAHFHDKKIAHRNLRLESILLPAGSDVDVKISDFTFAKIVKFPNSLRTLCGTDGYVAPEILEYNPEYDVPCDVWSLGVVFYIILAGYRPFRGEGEELFKQIRLGAFKFHPKYWSHVPQDAMNLVASMLRVDPSYRVTAREALTSPWLRINSGPAYC